MRPRILVVDDDLAISQGIKNRFHDKYDIVLAKSAAEALAHLSSDAGIAIILSDFRMPIMNGVELLAKTRAEYPLLVRMMLTGHADMQVAAAAVNTAGIHNLLFKPCLDDELDKALESALAHHKTLVEEQSLALIDHLLEIGNRRAFDQALTRTHGIAVRYRRTYGLAMVDVDHFKLYNDTYGHMAGDQVLKSIAKAIRTTCRGSDEAFRYGGEEIALLFPETNTAGLVRACERVRDAIESLAITHKKHLPPVITASFGAAIFDNTDPTDSSEILLRADQALYRSKETGRNRVTLWSAR